MVDTSSFTSFMRGIRSGNEDAARELVRRFEGVIRREARLRMEDHRLYRVFDSMDISQSVLTSFFARASTGHFDLETPEQLVNLLMQMTRNKLAMQVRRQRARRRDDRLLAAVRVDELNVESSSPGPCQLASDHDLIDAVRLPAGRRGAADRRPPRRGLGVVGDRGTVGRFAPGPSDATDPRGPPRGQGPQAGPLMTMHDADSPQRSAPSTIRRSWLPVRRFLRLWQDGVRLRISRRSSRKRRPRADRARRGPSSRPAEPMAGRDSHPGRMVLRAIPRSSRTMPTSRIDLIHNEFMLRETLGEAVDLQEFVVRFPQFAESIGVQVTFHQRPRGHRGTGWGEREHRDRPGSETPCRNPGRARRRRPRTIPRSRAIRSSGSWASVAWPSSTRPTSWGSTGASP